MNKAVIICGQYDNIPQKPKNIWKIGLELISRCRRTSKYKNNIHGFNFPIHN